MGKKIFMTQTKVNCFGCHNTDVFVMDNPRNNGLYTTNTDVGIYKHTNNPIDIGKFKAPSLKNIALRKRFMHDGSLQSLEDVVNHYNFNIQANPNLDPHLQDRGTNKPYVMNLSPLEVEAVVAFLHTLTDEVIVKDPKYSSPFK
jgi:cytochrome c peroxidase